MATPASQPFRLRDLLPEAIFLPTGCEPTGTTIHIDPKRVTPGDLYVHLDEFNAAGAELAAERGAEAVIAERLLPEIRTPLVVVDDVRSAYARLREAACTAPRGIDCFVVAGSVGRAVTSNLLSRIVSSSGAVSPRAVLALRADGEVSPSLRPQVVCLTNLRADALETGGERRWESIADHRDAIHRTFHKLDCERTLVVNADDQDAIRAASQHTGPLVTFGERADADVVSAELESFPGGQEFLVKHRSESAAVTVATPGGAYRSNCVAAIAAGLAAGVDLRTCVQAVEFAERPYGMLEPVICGQPFPVTLDRATRPIALRASIEAARPAGGGRLYAAIRLASDASVAAEQIAIASRLADRVIASTQSTSVLSSTVEENVTVVDDRLAALAVVLGLAEEGDAVLIAGCATDGMEGERRAAEGLLRRRLACVDAAAAA